jgi:CTP:molybdopterin cytidylyltransferase MocA
MATDPAAPKPAVRVFGLVPAAGSVAHPPDRLLEQDRGLGGRTVLEHVVESLLAAGLDGLIVLTRSDIDEELDLSEDPRFVTTIEDHPDVTMVALARTGISALADCFQPAPSDGVLVCPGDFTDVTRVTIRRCIAAYLQNPDSMVVTAHEGGRGYPLVFALSLQAEIDSLPGADLVQLADAHPNRIETVKAESPGETTPPDGNRPQP